LWGNFARVEEWGMPRKSEERGQKGTAYKLSDRGGGIRKGNGTGVDGGGEKKKETNTIPTIVGNTGKQKPTSSSDVRNC